MDKIFDWIFASALPADTSSVPEVRQKLISNGLALTVSSIALMALHYKLLGFEVLHFVSDGSAPLSFFGMLLTLAVGAFAFVAITGRYAKEKTQQELNEQQLRGRLSLLSSEQDRRYKVVPVAICTGKHIKTTPWLYLVDPRNWVHWLLLAIPRADWKARHKKIRHIESQLQRLSTVQDEELQAKLNKRLDRRFYLALTLCSALFVGFLIVRHPALREHPALTEWAKSTWMSVRESVGEAGALLPEELNAPISVVARLKGQGTGACVLSDVREVGRFGRHTLFLVEDGKSARTARAMVLQSESVIARSFGNADALTRMGVELCASSPGPSSEDNARLPVALERFEQNISRRTGVTPETIPCPMGSEVFRDEWFGVPVRFAIGTTRSCAETPARDCPQGEASPSIAAHRLFEFVQAAPPEGPGSVVRIMAVGLASSSGDRMRNIELARDRAAVMSQVWEDVRAKSPELRSSAFEAAQLPLGEGRRETWRLGPIPDEPLALFATCVKMDEH